MAVNWRKHESATASREKSTEFELSRNQFERAACCRVNEWWSKMQPIRSDLNNRIKRIEGSRIPLWTARSYLAIRAEGGAAESTISVSFVPKKKHESEAIYGCCFLVAPICVCQCELSSIFWILLLSFFSFFFVLYDFF